VPGQHWELSQKSLHKKKAQRLYGVSQGKRDDACLGTGFPKEGCYLTPAVRLGHASEQVVIARLDLRAKKATFQKRAAEGHWTCPRNVSQSSLYPCVNST